MAGYVVRQFTCPPLTRLNVEQLRWSRPTRYCYTKPCPSLRWSKHGGGRLLRRTVRVQYTDLQTRSVHVIGRHSTAQLTCNWNQGPPLFQHWFSMTFPWPKTWKILDLSAQHIFPSKRYTTYKWIPKLVVTVPVPVRISQ